MKSTRKLFSLVSLIGLFGSSITYALDDVDPISKLGTIKVSVPENVDITESGPYRIDILDQSGRNVKISGVEANKNYKLKEAKYCIGVYGLSAPKYTVKKCNYQVNRGQHLDVVAGLVKLEWSLDQVTADIGPLPFFNLSAEHVTANIPNQSRAMYLEENIGLEYLLPAAPYQVKYENISALAEQSAPLKITRPVVHNLDITPRDIRAEIIVTTEQAKYAGPSDNSRRFTSYGLISHKAGNSHYNRYSIPYYFDQKKQDGKYSNYKRIESWQKLVPIAAQESMLRFKVYPLDRQKDEGDYWIVVSGVLKSFEVKPNEVTNFAIEPVNVNLIDGQLEGFYTLSYREYKQNNQYINKFITYESSPTLARNRSVSKKTYFPTLTTVYLLKGYHYDLKSYLLDDAGQYTEQSSHELDYR